VPAPTDAAGHAESLNVCGAGDKTGSPAPGNEAGTHLKEAASAESEKESPPSQGQEDVKSPRHPEPARTVVDPEDPIQRQQDHAGSPNRPEPPLIGRHGLQQLDLLMITIEALDLQGNEAMVALLQQRTAAMGATDRVEFWKWRATNPLRQTLQRNRLKQAQVRTMVGLVCDMAAHLYPVLHQFISVREDQSLAEARWMRLTKRLQDLIRQRMNSKRAAMQKFGDDEHALAMTRQMVRTLAFSAGPGGKQRLLASLQDGMRR